MNGKVPDVKDILLQTVRELPREKHGRPAIYSENAICDAFNSTYTNVYLGNGTIKKALYELVEEGEVEMWEYVRKYLSISGFRAVRKK